MRTDVQPYSFTLDMIQIQSQDCNLPEISTDGLDLWGKKPQVSSPTILSFLRLRVEKTPPQPSKNLIQYSLTIQTEPTLTTLVNRLKEIQNVKKCPIEIPLSILKIVPNIKTKQLTDLLKFFPKLEELTLQSNIYISLYPVFNSKTLKKLTIMSGYIYFDPGEKTLIQKDFPKSDLKITFAEYKLQIHEPTTFFLISYTIILLFTLSSSIYMIDSAEKETILNSPGIQHPKIPFNKIWFPLLLTLGSMVAIVRLISFVLKMHERKNREIMRYTIGANDYPSQYSVPRKRIYNKNQETQIEN